MAFKTKILRYTSMLILKQKYEYIVVKTKNPSSNEKGHCYYSINTKS